MCCLQSTHSANKIIEIPTKSVPWEKQDSSKTALTIMSGSIEFLLRIINNVLLYTYWINKTNQRRQKDKIRGQYILEVAVL